MDSYYMGGVSWTIDIHHNNKNETSAAGLSLPNFMDTITTYDTISSSWKTHTVTGSTVPRPRLGATAAWSRSLFIWRGKQKWSEPDILKYLNCTLHQKYHSLRRRRHTECHGYQWLLLLLGYWKDDLDKHYSTGVWSWTSIRTQWYALLGACQAF